MKGLQIFSVTMKALIPFSFFAIAAWPNVGLWLAGLMSILTLAMYMFDYVNKEK